MNERLCLETGVDICHTEKEECVRLRDRIREKERIETRYQNLFEAVREAIVSLSPARLVVQANLACRGILGSQPAELLGRRLEQIFPLIDLPRLDSAFEDALNGHSCQLEMNYIRPSGKNVVLAVLLSPIRDADRVDGVLLTARDLTQERLHHDERSQLYRELQESHRALEEKALALEDSQRQLKIAMAEQEKVNANLLEIDRIKSDFIGIVSHELRTPLTFLLGSLEYLHESLPQRLQDDELTLLDYSMQGAHRLSDIVEDMLDIVRIEAEGFDLHLQPTNLFELLQEVRLGISWLLQERKLELVSAPEADWPKMMCDQPMLRRGLSDLLENAIKYTPDGGRIEIKSRILPHQKLPLEQMSLFYPDLEERLSWKGDYLEIMIQDNGVGISRLDLPRIFNRFFAAGKIEEHSSSKKFRGKGVGLGLALVKRIVHGHKGLVWAESPGTLEETGVEFPGSCISLLLPLDTPAPKDKPAAAGGGVPGRRPRILLIDDEPAIRHFAEVLLDSQFELQLAADGAQGLEMACQFKPDLILLDLYMQGMDGFEVCKKLKAQALTAPIPVAIFTAVARQHEREKGLSVGAVDYITKPFFPRELLKRIHALLNEHGFVSENLSRGDSLGDK
ncbi:MAG: response regulator [Deltaproteobacteria bacterium]|nr:response regulator [Deltaproteobacteria bacterium]